MNLANGYTYISLVIFIYITLDLYLLFVHRIRQADDGEQSRGNAILYIDDQLIERRNKFEYLAFTSGTAMETFKWQWLELARSESLLRQKVSLNLGLRATLTLHVTNMEQRSGR
jgi:hypothetical protein